MSTSTRVTAHAAVSETQRWHRAAEQLGIDARYEDGLGQERTAPLETVRGAMAAMGAPITSPDDALRWIATQQVRPSPLRIAWDGGSRGAPIPYGCHGDAKGYTLSAPSRYPVRSAPRVGAFLPLYALHTDRSLGIGDLSDLGALADACAPGGFVATLPLFANFTDASGPDADKFDPSPYAPISRSFFSELYLDPRATPEWGRCAAARELLLAQQPALEEELAAENVDYANVTRLRRPILQALADAARELDSAPDVAAYANFRAHGDEGEARFHRYVQARLSDQLASLAQRTSLYLDLPVGVHRAGFDAERFASDFLPGFSAGAPPDAMFRSGQCWGISALNPIGARDSAYASLRSGVETLSRYAKLLRLDHVMALHRTFCVPDGAPASEGVYIRAQSEELYAALLATAASAARPPVLIGEDLGTVPDAVRRSLTERGVLGMHVAQLDPALPVTPGTCASVNTHDLATFAAYSAGDDLRDFVDLGLLRREELDDAIAARGKCVAIAESYDALKTRVLQSGAAHVVLNLEDEWGERRPQNTPGTSTERPNFKRRAALSLSMMSERLQASKGAAR